MAADDRSDTERGGSRGGASEIHVLDLFAGAGGLTRGFQRASSRYATVRAVESDPDAAASYAHSFRAEVYAGKIEDWLRDEHVRDVDVVVGGPPCQGFSNLGKRDVCDERNLLWREYVQAVGRAKPSYFVLENVPAFTKSPQFELFRESMDPGGLLAEYSYEQKTLNAADFGAPQSRRRVIVIGHHRDLPPPGFPSETNIGRHITVGEAWKAAGVEKRVTEVDLPDMSVEFAGRVRPGAFKTSQLHLTRIYADISRLRFSSIPEGGNRFNIPYELLAPCWRKHRSGSGDVMGRLWIDRPSVTIRTEFHKPEKGRYLHPTEDRAITLYEGAVLQGFDDLHRWVGSKTSIARQIGNAVPVQLGCALGEHLRRALDGEMETDPAPSKQLAFGISPRSVDVLG